jgi:hypothetical protein
MKCTFRRKRWHGPALAVVALALVVAGGFAQTAAAAPAPTASAAGKMAPARQPFALAAPPQTNDGDIRDIRGPIHIPPPWLWAAWLTGSAALAALLYGGWRWKRSRTRAAKLLPYQIALARLDEARKLMRPENAREFSIAVSQIVRQFVEERFQVRAARRTTEEFLRDLLEPSDALLVTHRKSLADFLGHCDLAKFARWIFSTGEMTTMLQSAHDFVSQAGAAPAPTVGSPPPPPAADQSPASGNPSPPTLHRVIL